MGRPPTVSLVNVQLKSCMSSHDVGSIQVPLAAEEMSLEVEHPVVLEMLEVFDASVVFVEVGVWEVLSPPT